LTILIDGKKVTVKGFQRKTLKENLIDSTSSSTEVNWLTKGKLTAVI